MTSHMWRLILARLANDHHAEQIVHAEHPPWRHIVDGLLDVVSLLLADRSGAGIRLVERQIDLSLYCEARDRDNQPPDIGIIGRQITIWHHFDTERQQAS
ncbi:MAG: hypothetical protein ACLP9Y_15170 [Mycobacterium sp.]